jgi:hypothetical protein
MDIAIRECQWMGPNQDPQQGSIHMCGEATVLGRSYCADHVWQVYQKGSSAGTKRKIKEMEREFEYILKKELETEDE